MIRLRAFNPKIWSTKEGNNSRLEGHSDPSENYGAEDERRDVRGLSASRGHLGRHCSKSYCFRNHREELGKKRLPIAQLGRVHIPEYGPKRSLRTDAGRPGGTAAIKTRSPGRDGSINGLFPRLLKSLAFLVVMRSISSPVWAQSDSVNAGASGAGVLPVSLTETDSSLMELNGRGWTRIPPNRMQAFLQLSHNAQNERRSRTGGKRRGPKWKRGKEEEEETKKTKWTDFMSKFDIAKVHGSGVYVDLGGFATVGGYDYRMPTGKCPVVGKVVVLENGADFLKSIAHHDPKERGLAFPATKVVSNSSTVNMDSQQLSPVSAQVLRSWNYKHESDLSNCAEYARNIVPGSNRDSTYRYPFVYDESDKLCYILYSPMQYNQGVKYCDTDSADEGTSSLACMYPDKDKQDSHLFYGTSSLHMDWAEVCPVYPYKDSIFGSYNEEKDECVPINPIYEEDAENYGECSKILFEYSPSDVDVTTNNQQLSDVDRYKEAMRTGKIGAALSIMFSPRYSEDRPIYTRGVGINWATYSVSDKKCNILDEVPSCLIISNGNYALTSLSSPNEEDAIPYPCNINQGKGFLANPTPKKKPAPEGEKNEGEKKEGEEAPAPEAQTPASEFIPYTSLKKEGFVCDKYVHVRKNSSCGTYVECSDSPLPMVSSKVAYIIIAVISVLVVAVIAFVGYKLWMRRRYKDYKPHFGEDEEGFDDLEYQYDRDDYTAGDLHEGEWDHREPRASEITPVRLTRYER